MTETRKPIRIKVEETWPDKTSRTSFIVMYRRTTRNRVDYMSCTESPLALSNLFGVKTAEMRFGLEDCRSQDEALDVLRTGLIAMPHVKVAAI